LAKRIAESGKFCQDQIMHGEKRVSRIIYIKLIAFGIGVLFSVCKTLRYTNKIDIEHPCILVGFHDEILPILPLLAGSNSVQMVAKSQVGYALAKVLRSWGYKHIIHGSQGRSSRRVFLQLLREIKKGRTVVIAPDGSRGPRHFMKDGAIFLAKQGKVPMYIISPNYKGIRVRFLWDKFLLPYPFAKVTFRYERIDIPEGATKEEREVFRADAERRLEAICNPC
jgi:lysophospholipid acyltransferase (LPLAT)-like uncharacterized protein